MRSLPRPLRCYVGAVVVVGLGVLCWSAREVTDWPRVGLLALLFWLADSREIRASSKLIGVSAGFPVAVAAILLTGPAGACLICATCALAFGWHQERYKQAFNGAQSALSALLAGEVYRLTPGASPVGFEHSRFPLVLLAACAGGLVFFLINNVLVAFAVHFSTGMPLRRIWAAGIAEMATAVLGYGVLGLIMAVLWVGGIGPVAALLVLAPLLIARWAFQQYGEQHKAYEATVQSLIRAVETKDYYTRGHSERVSSASVMIARQIGMREDRVEMLRYAGMLHDVGKLGVPTKVLQKSGPLDEAEFAAITRHPTRGCEMVGGISFLDEAMSGIRHHHERIDGLGYPDGLAGAAIPEFARVIAVADAFDSMTSTRSYRGARSVPEAIAELRRWSGTQFDGALVEALVDAVERDGWQPSVAATDVLVDPAAFVLRDHDDPSADIAGPLHYAQPLATAAALPVERVS